MGNRADSGIGHGQVSTIAVIVIADPVAQQRLAAALQSAGIRTLVASDLETAASGVALPGSIVVTDAGSLDTLARNTRGDPARTSTVRFGEFTLDPINRCARWRGLHIAATASQFRVLEALVRARGDVVSLGDLAETLYGGRRGPGDHQRVRSHVKRLRHTLGELHPEAAAALTTVHGSGLCLVPGRSANDRD